MMLREPASEGDGTPGIPVPGPGPPEPRLRDRVTEPLKAVWSSRTQLDPVPHWLLFRGMPVLVLLGVPFLLTGVANGSWWDTFDVMLSITSPRAMKWPAVATALAVAGWLVVPAIVGAVAGDIVGRSIKAHGTADPKSAHGHQTGR